MGYDLRITRSTDPTRLAGLAIDSPDCLAPLRDDRLDGNGFTTAPAPAPAAGTKMLPIAEMLQDVVQGDDGECHESARQWTAHGDDAPTGWSPRRENQ